MPASSPELTGSATRSAPAVRSAPRCSAPRAAPAAPVPGGPGGGRALAAGASGATLDPQAVAAAIQNELALSEGTGVSAATERLLVAARAWDGCRRPSGPR